MVTTMKCEKEEEEEEDDDDDDEGGDEEEDDDEQEDESAPLHLNFLVQVVRNFGKDKKENKFQLIQTEKEKGCGGAGDCGEGEDGHEGAFRFDDDHVSFGKSRGHQKGRFAWPHDRTQDLGARWHSLHPRVRALCPSPLSAPTFLPSSLQPLIAISNHELCVEAEFFMKIDGLHLLLLE
jgi:hypothetical protein